MLKIKFMKRVIAALIIVFGLAAAAFAETSIKAEVDKASLTTDNILNYKLTVTSSEKQIPLPQLPDFKGFSIVTQAQSSSINFTKGRAKTVFSFIFILLPVEAGDITIGPASIKVDGNTYSTDAFKIKVSQGQVAPDAHSPAPPMPASGLPQYSL